jgi:hypothetical protein
MIREAIAYADELAPKLRRGFRFWNRQEGMQIDLGERHIIVAWPEIEFANINVLKLRMDQMLGDDRQSVDRGAATKDAGSVTE